MKSSVMSGYANHGTAAPGLANTYLFSDVCSGGIFAAVLQATSGVWKSVALGFESIKISCFGKDAAGGVRRGHPGR
jgi:hypothetical protein